MIMAFHELVDASDFENALQSCLNQTYQNIELILIGDGKESSVHQKVIDKFPNDRIKIFYLLKNSGPAKARNTGIKIAQGKFITICDSDDINTDDRIKVQLKYLTENQYDLIGAHVKEVRTDTGQEFVKKLPVNNDDIINQIYKRNPINNPAVFSKAVVMKENPYPEKMKNCEDYMLWVSLLKNGYQLGNTEEVVVTFKINQQFYKRRGGIEWARNDFKCRISSLPLYRVPKKVNVLFYAFLFFILRLMPITFLQKSYEFIRSSERVSDG